MSAFLKLYGVAVVVCLGLDLLWLGVLAKGFYRRQFGALMRADVQWLPAILFYLLYVAALVFFVVQPAIAERSLARAALTGAFLGLAAYAAFDLTGLALVKGFPPAAAVVDLAWGATLSAVVASATYAIGRSWS
jgi:uncharacterized membrane protein